MLYKLVELAVFGSMETVHYSALGIFGKIVFQRSMNKLIDQ